MVLDNSQIDRIHGQSGASGTSESRAQCEKSRSLLQIKVDGRSKPDARARRAGERVFALRQSVMVKHGQPGAGLRLQKLAD